MNKFLSLLAVGLASAALVAVVLNRNGNPDPTPTIDTGDAANQLATQFQELQKDHLTLKESHRELLNKVTQLERMKGSGDAGSINLARFQQRLDELDAKQAQLTQVTRDIDKHGVISGLEKTLAKAFSTLMDTNQTLMIRIRQADTLKRNGQFDERAIKVLTELYSQTGNFSEKAGVLNALSGVVSPVLRDQILADLNSVVSAGYTDPRFRYTAIEALEPMSQDPSVQQWLGHLAQNDPEPKLADRAGQALGIDSPTTPSPAR